uniref:Endonuclease domain containing-like protein n=1 Tax=Ctenopharyngodon idella TaxID=7959 RepID=K4JG08_CTEID|nr:endonuclease domain containing-like protein [Ctenopharyngodon idella]
MFVPALLICIVLRALGAQARVTDDFDCNEFFYKKTEPGGMDQNAKKICQQLVNKHPFYATLYSVHHGIPLYSAYKFDPQCFTDSGRSNSWHLEPQLSKPEEQDLYYMVRENQDNKNTYKGNQAISDDHSDTGYDRGHLNPNSFQCGEGRTATNTLTNAAPMDACFNRNQWGKWENKLRTFLRDTLSSDSGAATAFIVTGTVPNAHLQIPQKEISDDPERVTVPSHIWTAVCYEHSDDKKSFSFGYIGENKPEADISLMSVSDLNRQIKNLYSQPSEISIFTDDCFDDNNKLDKVKAEFQTLINLQVNQGVQMSSAIQNTYLAVKRTISSDSIPEKKVKVSEMTIKLAFDSMSAYHTETEYLKDSVRSACLITYAKPLMKYISKRDMSEESDAVECLLVPEKQKTAADGSQCLSVSESSNSCQCNTVGGIKPCCSTPCLYQDKLNSYRCYSGQTLIKCSPRYSLITYNGQRCKDDHPCATYGEDYYWCRTIAGSWDYCSPPLWTSKAINGKYCRNDHACAKYGSGYMWCYTDEEGSNDRCCTSDDCHSAQNGQTCRSNHRCGYHGKDYLWCYMDYDNNWDYCCQSCG